MGSTFICVVLGFNRFVEMIPSMKRLLFLFRGKMVYMWMVLSIVIMLIRPFFCRPPLYNSSMGTYTPVPFITDDPKWIEIDMQNDLSLIALRGGSTDHFQLLLQATVICSSNAVAAILYNVMKFVVVPKAVVIIAHNMWLLSHGKCKWLFSKVNKNICPLISGLKLPASV
ncbi:hypothetical protein OSTOST_16280 [Ostertagia ostertagi]